MGVGPRADGPIVWGVQAPGEGGAGDVDRVFTARKTRYGGARALSTPMRLAVVDIDEARRARLCAALIADPRAGSVHGFGSSTDLDRLGYLGVDMVVVSAWDVDQAQALVEAVRTVEAEAAVVATVRQRVRPGDSALERLAASADDFLLGVKSHAEGEATCHRLFCAFDRVRAANDARPRLGERPRARLVIVLGADSGTVARVELGVRSAGAACPAVLAVPLRADGRRAVLDGVDLRLTPGLVMLQSSPGRVLRCGEDLRWRPATASSAHAAQLDLVDSSLDACGPGVALLCVEPASVVPLARRRLLNDGAVVRRCDPRRLEWALSNVLPTVRLGPGASRPPPRVAPLQ